MTSSDYVVPEQDEISMPTDDLDKQLPAKVAALAFGAVLGVLFGLPLGWLIGVRGPLLFVFAFLSGSLLGFLVKRVVTGVSEGVANAFLRILWPSGNSTPYQQTYSAEQALAANGDLAVAMEAYRSAIQRNPHDPEPRLQAAELLFRTSPEEAANLFVEARRLCGDNRTRELYSTQRLIDLYLDHLGDRTRAMVELRRLAERFPGSREGEAARTILSRLKQEQAESQTE